MIKFGFLSIVIIFVITSCNNLKTNDNKFSSSDKIIKLETIKHKGCGLFVPSAGFLHFQEPPKNYLGLEFKLPNNIDSIKIATTILDIKPVIYRNFKNGGDTASFNYSVTKFSIDTASIPKQEIKQNYLSIIRGFINDSTIIIVDQNNNRDFTDDTIRAIKPMQWKSEKSLIGFNYQIFNGSKVVPAFSWVNIGESKGNSGLVSFVSQYVSSTFSIDDNSYTLAVSDGQWNCSFDEITIALVEENGIKKDSLITPDYLKRGEYLKLGSQYYRFENISNDGSRITLIKEDNFESKIGTQIGMIAPDFTTKSITGNVISSKDFKGQYLLLSNLTGCWSKISSYQHYKDMTEYLNGKLNFVGIDNSTESLLTNIKNLNLPGQFTFAEQNKGNIQKFYRPDFSSRTCFLINPTGRIIDKFEISDWKSALSKHFK
jgi:peroxiredoxin